jgi:hypothetical protein
MRFVYPINQKLAGIRPHGLARIFSVIDTIFRSSATS